MNPHPTSNRVRRWKVVLEHHDSRRRVSKIVTAEREGEACKIALRSQIGPWYIVDVREARDD